MEQGWERGKEEEKRGSELSKRASLHRFKQREASFKRILSKGIDRSLIITGLIRRSLDISAAVALQLRKQAYGSKTPLHARV